MPEVQPDDDGHGPLLPFPVPVQRDGHGAQPRAEQSTEQTAERLVEGRIGPGDGEHGLRVHASGVEDGVDAQEGEVRGAEERVGDVVEEGGAEEDKEDVNRRRHECRQ